MHQALFIANGQPIQGWLSPSGANLVGRLSSRDRRLGLAEELYLSLYSRRPTEEERDEVAQLPGRRGKDRVPGAAGAGLGLAGVHGISLQSLIDVLSRARRDVFARQRRNPT